MIWFAKNARHEAIAFLEEMGIFTERETKKAKKDGPQKQLERFNPATKDYKDRTGDGHNVHTDTK
jgi:hypothetical protein